MGAGMRAGAIIKGQLKSELFRFIVTGGMNTLLTIALYQLLVSFISPELSYAISWIAGFAFVAIAYPTYVFCSGFASKRQLILLAIFYLLSFALGLWLTSLFVGHGLHVRITVFAVSAVTACVSVAASIL